MSGEIGAAITKGLQKSAKTIIDNVDDFEKSLDKFVDAKKNLIVVE